MSMHVSHIQICICGTYQAEHCQKSVPNAFLIKQHIALLEHKRAALLKYGVRGELAHPPDL